jgi:hypothetical protein
MSPPISLSVYCFFGYNRDRSAFALITLTGRKPCIVCTYLVCCMHSVLRGGSDNLNAEGRQATFAEYRSELK